LESDFTRYPEYLGLLVLPVILLSPATPLVSAIPTLVLNISLINTRSGINHQPLASAALLLLAVISNLAVGRGWLRSKRAIIHGLYWLS